MSKALLTDLGSGKAYLVDDNATIGRSTDNDIVLNDAAVSGHHTSISSTGSAWYISDSGSRNGVEMNNFRVPSEGKLGLRNGCQLKLGNTLFRFTTDTDAIDQFQASQNRAKARPDYSDRLRSWAVLLNLMRLLPSEYYPSSLDEVEYIVLVDYNYRAEGSYRYVTVALQEYAEVSVLRATDLHQLYNSLRIDGNSAPSFISYSGTPPTWKSGNAPNMGQEIHTAISSIMY